MAAASTVRAAKTTCTATRALSYQVRTLTRRVLLAMPSSYEGWQALFSLTWVQVITQITFIAVVWHLWVGIRDLWMDYIKPDGLRLALHALTAVWLVGCLVYSFVVVWGIK
mgnify:CR=1 FL=1